MCGVAGNILHMLPTASSAEHSGLEYIFLDGLFKKNIDNICNVCGNLNGGLNVLGLSVVVEDDEWYGTKEEKLWLIIDEVKIK